MRKTSLDQQIRFGKDRPNFCDDENNGTSSKVCCQSSIEESSGYTTAFWKKMLLTGLAYNIFDAYKVNFIVLLWEG
jgi:hypothetical protein